MIYYLGGPIRTNTPLLFAEDIEWRQKIKEISRARELKVRFADPASNDYTLVAEDVREAVIYRHDLQLMHMSTAGIFNLLALTTGYPCQGALFEIGFMTGQGRPCYCVASPKCQIRKHPMYQGVVWFSTLDELHEILM